MRPQGAACCFGAFHEGMHPQGAACRFGKQEVPARGGALNLLSSCAIGASSLGHSMSLQCEGTPSWERGKKKIRTKTGTSLLPLVGGVVPPFGATPQTSCLRPLPVGFSLALLFPSTLSPLSIFLVAALELPCGCFSAVVVVGYALWVCGATEQRAKSVAEGVIYVWAYVIANFFC